MAPAELLALQEESFTQEGATLDGRRGLSIRWCVGKAPMNGSRTRFTWLCHSGGDICKSFCMLVKHLISNDCECNCAVQRKNGIHTVTSFTEHELNLD